MQSDMQSQNCFKLFKTSSAFFPLDTHRWTFPLLWRIIKINKLPVPVLGVNFVPNYEQGSVNSLSGTHPHPPYQSSTSGITQNGGMLIGERLQWSSSWHMECHRNIVILVTTQ